MRPANYDAVVFDLDGVITDTARVHVVAWKTLFDSFLMERSCHDGTEFEPFDAERDYHRYVDGLPRYDGVRTFLRSRGIEIPHGAATDPPTVPTVCGLGNSKDLLFLETIQREGVFVFDSTVRLVRDLVTNDIACAVASSSKNCRRILDLVGLAGLFAEIVDGVTAMELGLPGKPHAAIFLRCAAALLIPPSRCAVVEDALVGVEAGRNGAFGLTIGIDRNGGGAALLDAGADVVVSDLAGVSPSDIDRWFARRRAGLPVQ